MKSFKSICFACRNTFITCCDVTGWLSWLVEIQFKFSITEQEEKIAWNQLEFTEEQKSRLIPGSELKTGWDGFLFRRCWEYQVTPGAQESQRHRLWLWARKWRISLRTEDKNRHSACYSPLGMEFKCLWSLIINPILFYPENNLLYHEDLNLCHLSQSS